MQTGPEKSHVSRTDRSCRLIVRNLPFVTSKEDLRDVFAKVGAISEVAIPPCKDKRFPKSCAGFGFVNFVKKSDAAKAIEQLNFIQFKGRKIAVDWAVNKDDYVTNVITSEKKEGQKPADDEEKGNDENVGSSEEDEDKLNLDYEDDESITDECHDEDEDENSSDGESADNITDDDNEKEVDQNKKEKNPKKKEDLAVREGRVLFLRNLSFNTDKEQLEDTFSDFGEIQLAIVCCFSGSEHSKGTAFLHFKSKEGADSALQALNSEEGVLIDGRRINGVIAVPRVEASQFQNKEVGQKNVKDKRNLHLLRASFIRPGTADANNMSQHDTEKRQKLASLAKNKLRNLLMFVSPTRLVIYNVPRNWTDKTLRSRCIVATGNKDAQLTECKIWKDFTKLDARGLPESMGYAFVGFSKHEDAYACLKKMNNNPDIFTTDKRPIVQFCIENLQAVRSKERKLVKSKLPKGTDSGALKKLPVPTVDPAVEKAVEKTKALLSQGGQKSLPKRFGLKIRHRDGNKGKTQNKGKASRKRKSQSTSGKPVKKTKLNTKGVTKSLTMM
uniref:RNA-binding protein 28 n=1 Tax=Steinernema glaseri TaxID=37863 RepID=A0A1I7ZFK4_9BILA